MSVQLFIMYSPAYDFARGRFVAGFTRERSFYLHADHKTSPTLLQTGHQYFVVGQISEQKPVQGCDGDGKAHDMDSVSGNHIDNHSNWPFPTRIARPRLSRNAGPKSFFD